MPKSASIVDGDLVIKKLPDQPSDTPDQSCGSLTGDFAEAVPTTTKPRCPRDGYILNRDGSCTGCVIETL